MPTAGHQFPALPTTMALRGSRRARGPTCQNHLLSLLQVCPFLVHATPGYGASTFCGAIEPQTTHRCCKALNAAPRTCQCACCAARHGGRPGSGSPWDPMTQMRILFLGAE
jgi:hypothetical protein